MQSLTRADLKLKGILTKTGMKLNIAWIKYWLKMYLNWTRTGLNRAKIELILDLHLRGYKWPEENTSMHQETNENIANMQNGTKTIKIVIKTNKKPQKHQKVRKKYIQIKNTQK